MTAPRPAHTLISEAAQIHACPRCHRHTLIARVDGIITRADPENITTQGELTARLQKRPTFDIQISGLPPRLHLHWRTLDRIKAPRKYAVVASHKCSQPLPPQLTTPFTSDLSQVTIISRSTYPSKPPF